MTGLTNGDSYSFTVTATNAVGPGSPSAPSNPVVPATTPGVPTAVTATGGNASATVSWTAPASDGGSAVTSFAASDGSGDSCTTATTSCTVTGLTNGDSYSFTVTATNAVGPGSPSAPSNPVVPATTPGVPTAVTATGGNASATVSWTAPASDGGSAVTSFAASDGSGDSCTTATTSCTVTGLTNGDSYSFTVTATNAVGPGSPSAPSNPVVPATTPGVPTAVTATGGNASATVSWTAPASDGGSAVTSFAASDGSGDSCTTATTSCTVTGLTNGDSYSFTVTATNAVGPGSPSAPSNPVVPATTPGVPTAVTATGGNASATVSWTAPASDGGSAVTSFAASDGSGDSCTTATTSCTVTGLTNGDSYSFTVTATNAVGPGSPSAPSNPVVPSGLMSSVQTVTSGGDSSFSSRCSLLTSGGVDCWGWGSGGELGNGTFYTTGNEGSATPVQVVGVGGIGILTGVASIASNFGGYCALLISGSVDCWGDGQYGELGNGAFYSSGNYGSAIPVPVVGVGGIGTLSGVASLTSGDVGYGYCALLTSGSVDCWGYGTDGELGNGVSYNQTNTGSATPVQVIGVGGSGTLTGVASLSSDGNGFLGAYCAVLASGGVDCWGDDEYGQLGNGMSNTDSATPVQVAGVGGSGTLTGVASITSSYLSYCALLAGGSIDCWGYGPHGELGNAEEFYPPIYGSATPVQVVGLSAAGTLNGVSSLRSDGGGYCALLISGSVDCWGTGAEGELGNGTFANSHFPVQVIGVGGTGALTEVASLTSAAGSNCALLISDRVDCWGYGVDGNLGNGVFYTSGKDSSGSATPVQVVGVGGSGTLANVASITSGNDGSSCAVLTSGGVDCWGDGEFGELGNGLFYTSGNMGSDVPQSVDAPGSR